MEDKLERNADSCESDCSEDAHSSEDGFSSNTPLDSKDEHLPTLDYERLRKDLERYFDNTFFSGCGSSIVYTSGIVLADEATLLEYAKEAQFKLDKYKKEG